MPRRSVEVNLLYNVHGVVVDETSISVGTIFVSHSLTDIIEKSSSKTPQTREIKKLTLRALGRKNNNNKQSFFVRNFHSDITESVIGHLES